MIKRATVELPPSKEGQSFEFELPPKFIRDAEVYLFTIIKVSCSFLHKIMC